MIAPEIKAGGLAKRRAEAAGFPPQPPGKGDYPSAMANPWNYSSARNTMRGRTAASANPIIRYKSILAASIKSEYRQFWQQRPIAATGATTASTDAGTSDVR
jgi:hypothetical protein